MVSIEAVLQPRFHHAMSYFSFDAEVLFAFFAFGDTFFTLGLMVHIGSVALIFIIIIFVFLINFTVWVFLFRDVRAAVNSVKM